MKVHELSNAITTSSAIFGRKNNVTVVFEGNQAMTDGTVITIPAMPLNAEISEEKARIIRGFVDHEAGHIRHTDFTVLKKVKNQSEKNVWNAIEDIWLERRVMEEYVGSKKNLSEVSELVASEEISFLSSRKEELTKVNAANISFAICKQGRIDYAGKNNSDALDLLPDNIKEWSKQWVKSIDLCENSNDNLKLARAILKLIKEDPKLESDPKKFSFDPKDDKGEDEGKEECEGEDEGEGEEGDTQSIQVSAGKAINDLFIKGGLYKYEGVRDGYRSYSTRCDKTLTRNCKTVNKHDYTHHQMKKMGVSDYQNVLSKIGPVINVMRAKLRRGLLSKENRDWDFGRQQGRLDSKKLTSAYSGAEAVYKVRKDREEFDTAIHFLIDLSGSMNNQSKMNTAAYTAVALAECLEGSGVKYQISGFKNTIYDEQSEYAKAAFSVTETYHRYEPLYTYVFKGFNDSLNVSKGSLASLTKAASSNNSDAEALMWAYRELNLQPQKRKILVVLSDGSPCNSTINCDYYDERRIQAAALKDVVRSISKKVECIGIGICDSSVENFYKDNIVINKVDDLAGVAFNKLSKLLLEGKLKL